MASGYEPHKRQRLYQAGSNTAYLLIVWVERKLAILAKTKISIYLLKEDCDMNDILKDSGYVHRQPVGNLGVLFSKESRQRVPSWVENVFGGSIDADHLRVSSVAAVFIVPLRVSENVERVFAVSFGYGYTMLKQDCIENRFGLKTALNLADEASLRKINRTTVAGNASKTNEQLPKKASIADFSIDVQRDLLDGATVFVEEDVFFAGNVTGTDAFSASVDVTLANMSEILRHAYDLFCSDSYKKSFSWVDSIADVKSPGLVGDLNARLIELVNEGSPDIWMAVPELVEWENIEGFRIGGSQGICQDILIGDVLRSLANPLVEMKQLDSKRIRLIGTDGVEKGSWSAKQCLYGELSFGGKQYCVNGGKWYLIDTDFASRIDKTYNEAVVSSVEFPSCEKGMKEADYNLFLTKEEPEHRALMDARNISYGGGRSKVELCDVLLDDGRFIHVKKYSGSAVLSHLFNQGCVSAELVRSSESFRKAASEMIVSANPKMDTPLSRDSVKEVVFAIVTKDAGASARPNIPFFSKVTFDYASTRLSAMGVRVSIKAIPEITS